MVWLISDPGVEECVVSDVKKYTVFLRQTEPSKRRQLRIELLLLLRHQPLFLSASRSSSA